MTKLDMYPQCEDRQELADFEWMESHQSQCSDLIDAISDLSKDIDGFRYRVPADNALDLEWLKKTYQEFRDWADMLEHDLMNDGEQPSSEWGFEILGCDEILECDDYDNLCEKMGW